MSRFEVHPERLRVSAEQLQAVEDRLRHISVVMSRLGNGGLAAFSPEVAASVDGVEERWSIAAGAMGLGVSHGAVALEHSAKAYEHVDRHAMPTARPGG